MRIGWKGWIVAAIAAVIVVLVFRGVVGLAIYAAGVAIYWLVGMAKDGPLEQRSETTEAHSVDPRRRPKRRYDR